MRERERDKKSFLNHMKVLKEFKLFDKFIDI